MRVRSMIEDLQGWNDFRFIASVSSCWWCGLRFKPPGWFAPWLIERAHIVSSPRRKDRRVAALLCSRCHKVSHGERILIPGSVVLKPSVEHLLWLKRVNDPEFYDRDYMARNCLGLLPAEVEPPEDRSWVIPAHRWGEWLKRFATVQFSEIQQLRKAATEFGGYSK